MNNKRIAIIYDWLDKWGGVERVLLTLKEMYPKAVFYTSYVDYDKVAWAKEFTVKTSFIQHLPRFIRRSRILSFILYPLAFESFDFTSFDTVISVTSSFAKGIITKPGTKHICYLLTPTRYLWVYPELYINRVFRTLLMPVFSHMRRWDKIAAKRPDTIIALSKEVAHRCKTYYQRESSVIYPPFDLDYWSKVRAKVEITKKAKSQPYFLVVSRLEPYKKVELVIDAFEKLKKKLIVVGSGSLSKMLKEKKAPNTTFYEHVSDEKLGILYANAQALIMPQIEDFGYVSLEAQFFGCPVISLRRGGAKETIHDGVGGVFFEQQRRADLTGVLERWDKISYNLSHQKVASRQDFFNKFSKNTFRIKFNETISNSA